MTVDQRIVYSCGSKIQELKYDFKMVSRAKLNRLEIKIFVGYSNWI